MKHSKASKLLYFCLFILGFSTPFVGYSQSLGFEFNEKTQVETLPFEYINGFIVVEIVFNQTFPLKFIVDTGASNTIIAKKEIVSIFNLPYGRTFEVYGADLSTVLYAHLVKDVHLSAANLKAPHQDILVLEEDYFDFQRITGLDIHGVLGADMFRNHVMQIDYKKGILSLHRLHSKTIKYRGYKEIDLVIQKSKPYVVAKTRLSNNTVLDTKLLIDTGASTALLLDTNSDESLILPESIIPDTLGFGLGGNMKGYIGRVSSFQLGKFKFDGVICRFQQVPKDSVRKFVARNGIIGNHILDRFSVILDYPQQRLFIKPTRRWKRSFSFDKSGINFISVGLHNRTYYVNSIIPGSPADLAGVQAGDIIQQINNLPNGLLTFNSINRILHGKSGKKVKVKVKRENQTFKIEFRLKDLI